MDMLVRRRLPGREIGQGISWNFTFETVEAMNLVHISVYLAQHLWTKLGRPLDEKRLLPGLPSSSAPPSSAALRAFPPPWVLPCCCFWCSADPRLRDAVFPLLSCETRPHHAFVRFPCASLLLRRASWLPPLPFADAFLLLSSDGHPPPFTFLHLPA